MKMVLRMKKIYEKSVINLTQSGTRRRTPGVTGRTDSCKCEKRIFERNDC